MGIIGRRPPPCPACHDLGEFEHDGVTHKLYYCLQQYHSIPLVDPEWPTVMARYGPGDENFTDGVGAAETDPVLGEAKRRAVEQGLYDPNKPLQPGMKEAARLLGKMVFDSLMKEEGSEEGASRGTKKSG